jgi:hypothetical protein
VVVGNYTAVGEMSAGVGFTALGGIIFSLYTGASVVLADVCGLWSSVQSVSSGECRTGSRLVARILGYH